MDALWHGYDRTGLDAQYFLRKRVPTFQQHFDNWKARSEQTRARSRHRLNLRYGASPAETLDWFFAERPQAPVQVFIHGGYWQSMDKNDSSYIADGFVPQAHCVLLNYALAPSVGMDEIVGQVRSALAWIFDHAAEFDADPTRIFVSGHSAGGHLTAMTMLADGGRSVVKGGCAISGLFDLEPVRLCYLNDAVKLDAAAARRNSPLHLLDRVAGAGPLILCVGDDETPEFLWQQSAFAEAWRQRGLAADIVPAPGLHHFNIVDELAEPGSALNRAVRRQMGIDQLKPEGRA